MTDKWRTVRTYLYTYISNRNERRYFPCLSIKKRKKGESEREKPEREGPFPSLPPGADPGFFLGGGALVSCSTSTPINHIVFFFGRIPVVLENRRSSQGVRTPRTLPLDPPLTA